MMHARLVQRGLKRWLTGGLNRAIQLVRRLSGQIPAVHKAGRSAELAEGLLRRIGWADVRPARRGLFAAG